MSFFHIHVGFSEWSSQLEQITALSQDAKGGMNMPFQFYLVSSVYDLKSLSDIRHDIVLAVPFLISCTYSAVPPFIKVNSVCGSFYV
jgi:hypothetical protein